MSNKKLKVIFVGDGRVGKTSIISQYVNKNFTEEHILTTSGDKSFKSITIDDQTFDLEIWDTAGQEMFRNVNKIFMKNSKIAIIVIDITNINSMDGLEYWTKQIKENLKIEEIITAIAANKSDLYEEKAINNEDIIAFQNKNNINVFCETSAKDYVSINNLFQQCVKSYIEKQKEKKVKPKIEEDNNDTNNQNFKITNETQKKTEHDKKKCCFGKN
jgi:small GTP-binding protein